MASDTKEVKEKEGSEKATVKAPPSIRSGETRKKAMRGASDIEERDFPPGLKPDYPELRANIEGGVPAEYAGHHLIPVSLAPNSVAMRKAGASGLYDINNGNNGIALPTREADAERTGLCPHNGKHIKEYTDDVAHRLSALDERYRRAARAGRPWTDTHLVRQVHGVEDSIRADLTEHRVVLQKTDPNREDQPGGNNAL